MGWHAVRLAEKNASIILVRKPCGKRLLGRPRKRWEDNIKMYLREVDYEDGELI
jgi:hypothetical protein